MIGIPLRVVVSERGLKDGTLEVKRRTETAARNIPSEGAGTALVDELRGAVAKLAEENAGRKAKRAAAASR